MSKIDITKVKTFGMKNRLTGAESIYHNTGERRYVRAVYEYYFKTDSDKYGEGGLVIGQEFFDKYVEVGDIRVIEEFDEPKRWKKGRIWEAIEADGHEKYDAFVSLIKDTLCPLNPEENEKAYFIEDVVNEMLADMFGYLERRF